MMKKRGISAVAISAVLVVLGSAPAEAVSGSSSGNTATFAVFGDVGHAVGESFPVGAMATLGLSADDIDALSISPAQASTDAFQTTTATTTSGEEVDAATGLSFAGEKSALTFDLAAATPAAPSGSYATVSTWSDRAGRFTRLRLGYWTGSAGFGYTKVRNYHNLTVAALKATTKYYTNYWVESGPTRVYLAPVNHIRCSGWWVFRTCKVIDTTVVRLIHSNRVLSDGGYFGVVTAYCAGYTRCPDWVKNAANL